MAPRNTLFMGQLPEIIPIFPLTGALLLPRGTLPLHIFEPRYLEMMRYARENQGVIGMIQPNVQTKTRPSILDDIAALGMEGTDGAAVQGHDNFGTAPRGRPLYMTGCVGMITEQSPSGQGDGLNIVLTGLSRFDIVEEVDNNTPFRMAEVSYDRFVADCRGEQGGRTLDRTRLMAALEVYLEIMGLRADWKGLDEAGDEELLNVVSMVCPLSPPEKQIVLETPELQDRCDLLLQIMEFTIAGQMYNEHPERPVH